MAKVLKYGFLVLFAALAIWGIVSLFIPSGTGNEVPDSKATDAITNTEYEDDKPETVTPTPVATPTPEPTPTPTPEIKLRVVLDPGHGGYDPGAVVGDAYEKDIDLAVALLVREALEAHEGIAVSMTREDDSFVSLSNRATFANENGADLFVSIHSNVLENNNTWSGIYTFYYANKPSSETVAQSIQTSAAALSGGIDRGVSTANYQVLRQTKMDAALIELGFMTCPEELASLLDPEYQKLLAEGIAQGILDYIEET